MNHSMSSTNDLLAKGNENSRCATGGTFLCGIAVVVIALLVGSTSCNVNELTSGGDPMATIPERHSAPDPSHTLSPVPSPGIATPLPRPTATLTSQPSLESGVLQPLADPTVSPTAQTQATEEVDSEGGGGELSTTRDKTIFSIPGLADSRLEGMQSDGEPFARRGPAPQQIVASTDDCRIVAIDSSTRKLASIWNYPNIRAEDFYHDGPEELSPNLDIPCDYINGMEWIGPNYLLLSLCCEPVDGRFELIDIFQNDGPHEFQSYGYSMSVNSQNVLIYSRSNPFRMMQAAVALEPFALRLHQPDMDSSPSFFYLESDPTFLTFSLDLEEGPYTLASVSELSWVGDSKIAFELWTESAHPYQPVEWYPFIGLIDISSHSVVLKTRGAGWTLPTGDAGGNLVVVEQACMTMINRCSSNDTKIVVLDPDTLAPVYEVDFDRNIVDVDLARGWLLVTFLDGQMGTVDLADGSFAPIADGIVNAGWME